jgi:hypothetical protein
VADDWRLTARLTDDGTRRLLEQLREHEADDAVRHRLGGAVAVSGEGNIVYAYADTAQAIHEAEAVVRALLAEHGVEAEVSVDRWHDLEQSWEDESVPLPQTEDEREAERERLEATEEAESRASGRALWEVRLELPSHGRTRELADRLEQDGLQVIRRWTFLLVGADSEDDARELAERLQSEAPDAAIQVEPSGEMVAEVAPGNPFAIFGGLAG